jgi:hypothetical protein
MKPVQDRYMEQPLTPLKDLVILKNLSITKMPIRTVAKNHGLSVQSVADKAKNKAALVYFMAGLDRSQTMQRLHLSSEDLDAILDYHNASECRKGGV